MSIALTRIEPDRGMRRYYSLSCWPDLFGGVSVVREWGRIGSPGRLRCDPYPGQAEAEAALEALRRRKIRRGYREAR